MDVVEWLSRAECLALLRTGSVGRIAYSERALPAIATVPYVVVHDLIVVRADGRSPLGATLRGAVVAFQAERDEPTEQGWSVTCIGRAVQLTDRVEQAVAAAAGGWSRPLGDYFQLDPELLRGMRNGPADLGLACG